ncbi:MAG: hypothetical protein LBN97_04625 [Oscillospiraceae bacterium]|nr:hypothetical protein [Oscillospiraceae bacterium]
MSGTSSQARADAYSALKAIKFEGIRYRGDIGV